MLKCSFIPLLLHCVSSPWGEHKIQLLKQEKIKQWNLKPAERCYFYLTSFLKLYLVSHLHPQQRQIPGITPRSTSGKYFCHWGLAPAGMDWPQSHCRHLSCYNTCLLVCCHMTTPKQLWKTHIVLCLSLPWQNTTHHPYRHYFWYFQ